VRHDRAEYGKGAQGRAADVVLVDTSAWIEVFRRPQRLDLESIVDFVFTPRSADIPPVRDTISHAARADGAPRK
jgi:hypothetical protein